MSSVDAPGVTKAPGPSLRVAVALIVAGAALMIPTVVAGIAPIVHAVTSPIRFDVPGAARMNLGAGAYLVYEDRGTASLGSAFSPDDTVTITPADVTVTGSGGTTVPVFERGSTIESLTTGGQRFVGAVRFTTPAAGVYTISVVDAAPGPVVVARPLTDTIRSVVVWFLLAALGGVVIVVGIVLVIVGSVRRGRSKRANSYVPSVAPGWHPDPSGASQWRYWDGYQWTDHVR